ncbi:hypothetical protein C8R45DRAFT_897009 [Mycena sanguinolenta]|nr:hypothetical protein C8R45DRAFT_897009 [Mycena sanguinolenta]
MDLASCYNSATNLCETCSNKFEHISYNDESALSALRANYSPEGAAIDEVILLMAEIDSQLEHYDPEISRLRKILADLEARKAHLQWYHKCCSSIISPIRQLPPEVLGMIFLGCMGPEPNVIPVVGQVCRHWRDLVEGTPRLWSNLSIGRKRFSFHQRYVNMASLFLKRSANRPLSISIRNPADARLVTLVRRHADRWATLRLASTDNAFYNSLGLDSALPMLEKLEILEAVNRLANSEPIPLKIHNAPKLKHVVLKDGPEYWDLPWTQLTHLEYDTSHVIDAVYILRMCPHLEECSLGMLDKPVEDPEAIPTIRPLLKLRSLRLAIDTVSPKQPASTMMSTFFSAVTAPALTSLEVIGQWAPTEFTDFLTRNQCQLTHLSMRPGYMKDDKIIDVLQALPTLNTLLLDVDIGTSRQVQNRTISDKLLRRLIFYPDSDCVLPCLTHLSLKTSVNFSDRMLIDVLESRWIPWVTELYGVRLSRLASVNLELCGKKEKLESWSVAELRDMAAAGMLISLQQGPEKIPMISTSTEAEGS